MRANPLYQVDLDVEGLPFGMFKYSSMGFAKRNLPNHLVDLFEKMSQGIPEPRITYRCQALSKGSQFGHGDWHRDGMGEPNEIHRLLTLNGNPTLGFIGEGGLDDGPYETLHAGTVWEFRGDYWHKAVPSESECKRLMLRVSRTEMIFRNHWYK